METKSCCKLVNVFGAFRALGKPGQILMDHSNRSALNGNRGTSAVGTLKGHRKNSKEKKGL